MITNGAARLETMVHGIAKLAITGRLPFRSRAETPKFAKVVIDHSLAIGR